MEKRSKNILINILLSFFWKGISVVLSMLILPLTVSYLTVVEYGVWITLFTVMNWVNLLDIGIGLGMRNKLAEAISLERMDDIKSYVSTGFVSILVLGILIFSFFYVVIQFVDFQSLFNTTKVSEEILYKATLYTGIFVIISFALSMINNVFYAYQKANLTGVMQIVHNAIMLLVVWLLISYRVHDFLYFIFAYGIALFVSRCIMCFGFLSRHRECIPEVKFFKIDNLKDMTNVGLQFFIIQIACIVVFSSSSILITQFLGIEYVREYDIAFKIFSVITMLHTLISTPLWNGYTDAYVRGDFCWIRKTMKTMIVLMIPLLLAICVINHYIDLIITLYIRQNIKIDNILCIGMSCFAFISCWNNIFAMFINGIGKIKIQMYTSVFSILVLIPIAVLLMNHLGVAGMIFAISIVLLLNGIPIAVQSYYILK